MSRLLTGQFTALFIVVLLTLISPWSSQAYYTNMPASVVVGQPDFESAYWQTAQNRTNWPSGVFTDGQKLFIADNSNNRVLIFNSIPTANNAYADLVIGQNDFVSASANQGGSPGPNTLKGPGAVYFDGQRLFISDQGNSRVLIYNSLPTTNGASADLVIGQPDFSTGGNNQGGLSASSLYGPGQILSNGKKIIIGDVFNNRVLIFNDIPTTNGAPADLVIGQTNMTTNSWGLSADKLHTPNVWTDWAKIVVTSQHNRVLIFNSFPTTNGASADVVIGQPNFTSNTANQGTGPAANTIWVATAAASDGTRLFISDYNNRRILVFNQIPTSNNASADVVIGQPDFASNQNNQGGSRAANTLRTPGALSAFGNKLAVADYYNSRILIFEDTIDNPIISLNTPPTELPEGKHLLTGSVTVDYQHYDTWKVEASVNGGNFGRVSLEPSQPHSNQDSKKADFSHEFEPWHNNNGDVQGWKQDFGAEVDRTGYTVSVRAYNTNTDKTEHAFYFTPFTLSTNGSTSSPTFSARVNRTQHHILRENLSHYRLSVKPKSGGWYIAADQLPVAPDSKLYESPQARVSYSDSFDQLTISLTSPLLSYSEVVLEAIDHAGHIEATNTVTLGSDAYINTYNLPITTEWFPLQINRISSVRSPIISTTNPTDISSSFTTRSLSPTFSGIAFGSATVNLLVVNSADTTQQQTFQTVSTPASTWTLTPSLYQSSNLYFSVEDTSGRYNQLPVFTLTR